MAEKRTVSFDFDGVIHQYDGEFKGNDIITGGVVPGIKETIQELSEDGFTIVVSTTRCIDANGKAAVKKFLDENGIRYDELTCNKVPCIVHVDDRAICFDGYPENLAAIIKTFAPWWKTGKKPTTPVMRECVTRRRRSEECVKAWFHTWTTVFIDDKPLPAAIIELEDGSVKIAHPESIRFTDREAKE